MRRVLVLVLHSLGIGATQDAECFGDQMADTLGHLSQTSLVDELPHLAQLGLFEAYKLANGHYPAGCKQAQDVVVKGAYAACEPLSSGKDSPSTHWELVGVPALFDWDYFHPKQETLPADFLRDLKRRVQISGVLGNCHADGLELIQELGRQHIETGKPIIYTSGDSLLQVAAHEHHFGLERLLDLCRQLRQLLDSPEHDYTIGRVIARPFVGETAGQFVRTINRRDFVLAPPAPTVLDKLIDAGGEVIAIGQIADIYARQGISHSIRAKETSELLDNCIHQLKQAPANSLVLADLLRFDLSAHSTGDSTTDKRQRYLEALKNIDARIPELIDTLRSGDLLLVTADGGADFDCNDCGHTREQVPLLITGPDIQPVNLGRRSSLADIGQTIASGFALEPMSYGQSLVAQLYGNQKLF